MKVEHFRMGKVLLVIPQERRLDAGVTQNFKSKMNALIDEGNMDIVIDLSKVTFIDSSGLGALVSILKRIGTKGEIRLCGLRENIKSLFQLTRLDKVFTIYLTKEEALSSFDGS